MILGTTSGLNIYISEILLHHHARLSVRCTRSRCPLSERIRYLTVVHPQVVERANRVSSAWAITGDKSRVFGFRMAIV